MSCYACGEEKIIDATTTYMVDISNEVLVIKNVPCRRCEHCGKGTVSFDVAIELEKIRAELRKETRHIHIYDYHTQARVSLDTA